MKKIFSIISAVVIVFVGVFLTSIIAIKKNIGFAFSNPESVIVYYKSNNPNTYEEDSKEYQSIVKELNELTNISLFKLAINNNNLNYKVEYNSTDYSVYDEGMNSENLVIEISYDKIQNVVVYEEGNGRTIPYVCLRYVIPIHDKFDEIVVYYSRYNGGSQKLEQYKTCAPIILKGNAKSLIKCVEEIQKKDKNNSK